MFAKMILPFWGGSPSVWNTCLVFYQAVLLLGYLYAHFLTKKFSVRLQVLVHLGIVWVALFTLPIAIPRSWTQSIGGNPNLRLFMLLFISVGLPFFIVSTTAPLLQRWFSVTGHVSSRDPYFLYSASNLGSIFALLSFPILLEPLITLSGQAKGWSFGYGVMAGMISACAWTMLRSLGIGIHRLNMTKEPASQLQPLNSFSRPRLLMRERVRWVVLAFAPSSLLLSVTNYITMDIAAVPLLWIIPLGLYLITFVLVFSPKTLISHRFVVWLQPFILLPLIVAFPFWGGLKDLPWYFIPLHLTAFFVTSMVCHGELAHSRPSAFHLTEFYLWLSVGGVLGGIFNALVAPLVFNSLAEYPLVMILSCFLRPRTDGNQDSVQNRRYDIILPLIFFAIYGAIILVVYLIGIEDVIQLIKGSPKFALILIIIFSLFTGLPLYSFRKRPLRFGFGVGGAMLVFFLWGGRPLRFGVGGAMFVFFLLGAGQNQLLYSERSFFGVVKVEHNSKAGQNLLFHGTTLHGVQSLEKSLQREPLGYYHRSGPLGQIFEVVSPGNGRKRIAVIGLGAGSMAGYAEKDQQWVFYEIDPIIEKIARDRRYFTYLENCPARFEVILGDGRLSLAKAPDFQYDLIIIDAFSSDSIPMHLLTREAMTLYLRKVAKHGILAFHISNRYLDLQPVLGNLAGDLQVTLRVRKDTQNQNLETDFTKLPSTWAVMAHQLTDMGKINSDGRWKLVQPQPEGAIWTDDFSNILSVFIW